MATIATAEVRVVADTSRFLQQLRRQLRGAFGDVGRGAADQFNREFNRRLTGQLEQGLQRTARRAGRGFGATLTRGLTASLRGLGQALSAISIRPLQGLGSLVRELSEELVSMAGIGLAVIGFLQALSGALFALPAAIGVVAAGIATAAVAFQGFGTAIGAAFDDTAAFNDAIADLAPAAADVAREFQAIAPALTSLRLDTQNALFSQLSGTITAVADNLLGPLREGMTAAGTALGGLIAAIGEFFAQAATGDTVNATFQTMAAIFDGLAASATPFLEGMRTLTDQFLPRIAEAAGPLSGLGAIFRDWATAVTESGQAMEAFDFALEVISTIGAALLDLGGIFQAMFSAAEAAGVNALGAVGEALEVIRSAFESIEGQAALANIFGALGDTINALAPVFGTLLTQLGLVTPIVADLAEALGPSLSVVIEGLGQAILGMGPGLTDFFAGIAEAAEAIAPALAPLGQAIGDILSALAPLLPVIGEIIGIVAEFAAELLSVLVPAIEPVVDALVSSLAPILPEIADLLGRLLDAVAPLIEAVGGAFAEALAAVLPPLLEVALALADALLPIIEALIPIIVGQVDVWAELIQLFADLLLPVVEALIPFIELLAAVLAPILEVVGLILEPLAAFIGLLADALAPIIEPLAGFIADLAQGAFQFLIDALIWLVGVVRDHVIPWIEEAWAVMQVWWQQHIKPLIERIRELASAAKERFNEIRDTVTSVMDRVGDAISGAIDWVVNFKDDVAGALDTARDTFNEFRDNITDIWDSITGAIESAAETIDRIIGNITGWINDAIDRVQSLGDIDLNPFANGGIVTSPTAALIGEAGPEVVIPLSRPARAAQLAEESGLAAMLAGIGGGDGERRDPIEVHMHVASNNTDPDQVARKAIRQIRREIEGGGLERLERRRR